MNSTNPTEPGGLLNGSDAYWGSFTIDESTFQIASFDLFLAPQAIPYSGLPCPPCSFTFNQPLIEINSAKLNSLSSLSVGPVLGGAVPVDLVTLLFSGTGALTPDATPGAPNPAAIYGITLILDFYQPPADFVGGYIAAAASQLRLFTADVTPFPFLSGVNQSDTRFTAIAIDPQVAASIPEPGTCVLAGIALGMICAAARTRL